MPSSEIIHADQGRKLLIQLKMSGKGMLYYLAGVVLLIVAAYFFFRWLDLRFLIPLALAVAAVFCFWQGSKVSKKK